MNYKTKELIIKIKDDKPLVLSITKYFPLELIVSGLRSIGALPITSNAEQEIEELLKLSKTVVINLGKLDDEFIKLCDRICEKANEHKKPIILDPVGAGASCYRTKTALNLLKKHKIAILRGYPSEIAAIVNEELIKIGTEASTNNLVNENAKALSKKYEMAVVVSGKINTVIDGDKADRFNFDSDLLHKVAGIGSLLSSIIAAFHAVEKNRFIAAASAVAYYAECVGTAQSKAYGPGSFKMELLDELYVNSYRSMKD